MDPSMQMSPAARALQTQFMNNPEMLQRFYSAYHEHKLPQPQLAAFQELLSAAEQQDSKLKANQQVGMQQQQQSMPQLGQQSMPQFGQQQPVAPSPQPSYMGQQGQQSVQQPPPMDDAMVREQIAEFQANTTKQRALQMFLGRTDVAPEQRAKAVAELERAKAAAGALQQRIRSNPQLMRALQSQAQQVGLSQQNAAAQNQRLLQAQQAQARQQTRSPSMGNQQLPAPQNPNIARARSPSNVPNGTATPPPNQAQQRAAAAAAAAAQGKPPQGAPSRPQSAAPGQSGAFNPVVQGPTAIADDITSRVTQSRPEMFPNARPTLTQGLAAQPSVSTPAITRPPVSAMPSHNSTMSAEQAKADLTRIVPRRSLRDILASEDPGTTMDEEVEDLLLEIADEFIESATKHSCALAVHRKSERLEAKDVQLHLERVWGITIPGYASDDVRQSQARRLNPPASQTARAAAVREARGRRQ